MKSLGLLAALALLLAACDTGTAPVPSGGSAGSMGESYCETVPTNPDDLEQWNQLCQPDDR
jgi:hypothetical protein